MRQIYRTAADAAGLVGQVIHAAMTLVGDFEARLRWELTLFGFPRDIQTVLMVVVTLLLAWGAVHLLGGIYRFIVILALLVIASHFVITTGGI